MPSTAPEQQLTVHHIFSKGNPPKQEAVTGLYRDMAGL